MCVTSKEKEVRKPQPFLTYMFSLSLSPSSLPCKAVSVSPQLSHLGIRFSSFNSKASSGNSSLGSLAMCYLVHAPLTDCTPARSSSANTWRPPDSTQWMSVPLLFALTTTLSSEFGDGKSLKVLLGVKGRGQIEFSSI